MKLQESKTEIVVLVILLVGALVLYGQFLISSPVTMWDENVYLGNARSHITTSSFTEDFRFPLLEWVISGVWMFTGESLPVARSIMVLFSLVSIVGVFLLSKEVFTKPVFRLASTALFAFSPLMVYWSFRIYTDIPALCCMVFSLWLFLRAMREKNTTLFFIAGILAGFAFLFRFPIILFATVLGMYLLFKKHHKRLTGFVSGVVLALVPWLLYNGIVYNNPFWDLLAQGKAVASYTTMQPASLLFSNILSSLGFVLIGLIPLAWWLLVKKGKSRHLPQQKIVWILLSCVLLEILFYSFVVKLKLARYLLSISPLLIILSLIGICWLSINIRKYRQMIVLFVLVVFFLQIGLLGYEETKRVYQEDFCRQPVYEATKYLKQTYPSQTSVVSNSWPWYGYYNNFTVSSTWTENIDLLIRETDAEVIILSRWGLQIDKESFISHPRTKELVKFNNSCGDEVIILSTT